MFTRRERSLVRAGAAAGVCAVLALTGCSGGSPDTAAYVGNAKISERQVSEAVGGVSEAFGPENKVDKRAIVDAMIRGAFAEQLATERRIAITDADRDAKLKADQSGTQLLRVPAARVIGYDLADEQIVAEKVGSEAYLDALSKTSVKLNPRYGTWKAGVQDESSSLSQPATPETPK